MEPPPDYSSWSNADLIQRVSTLEAQLRAINNSQHPSIPATSTPIPGEKPKKASKPFDPSRYHTRLIALKFAYIGANYNGFEHHANNTTPLTTIEEELWRALRKTRLIFPNFPPPRQENGEVRQKKEEEEEEEDVCWDGVEYSKCGRTDRGVSAFGQVVGLRVRSARPKRSAKAGGGENGNAAPPADEKPLLKATEGEEETVGGRQQEEEVQGAFDPLRDELPYIQLLNRVLPPDIRVLAWCPNPPTGFSARFNCRERRYRYFFTNPTNVPLPTGSGRGGGDGAVPGGVWLDIEAMRTAAAKYVGLHDFRNFCKIDASKQIASFQRRIFHAGIHEVNPDHIEGSPATGPGTGSISAPKLYYFEVRGSAFLWHQVRHLVAVLFLIGQGYERPEVIDELLDGVTNPARPLYEMASDVPLVLWDCIFPNLESAENADHGDGASPYASGYSDALEWVYVGDEAGGRYQSKRQISGVQDGKHGANGVMEDLWALWRRRKMHEILAWNLMDVVYGQGKPLPMDESSDNVQEKGSDRIFEGSELPRSVGSYVPIMHRGRMEAPEVVNARYAVRKGLSGRLAAEVAPSIESADA